jgi:hypothetical protein
MNVDKRNRFWLRSRTSKNLKFWVRFDFFFSLLITYYVEHCVWTLSCSQLRNSERKKLYT